MLASRLVEHILKGTPSRRALGVSLVEYVTADDIDKLTSQTSRIAYTLALEELNAIVSKDQPVHVRVVNSEDFSVSVAGKSFNFLGVNFHGKNNEAISAAIKPTLDAISSSLRKSAAAAYV